MHLTHPNIRTSNISNKAEEFPGSEKLRASSSGVPRSKRTLHFELRNSQAQKNFAFRAQDSRGSEELRITSSGFPRLRRTSHYEISGAKVIDFILLPSYISNSNTTHNSTTHKSNEGAIRILKQDFWLNMECGRRCDSESKWALK